ncbi:MAG: orotate phosphoribosyltransferase [Tissierellaceae bacterium]|jgi:orotate phosphoribosyltransferase|nr:orotate phosphoribosyltransferase [Tissierellia bacterium]
MIDRDRIRHIFYELDVLRRGHFLYTSGRHGEVYMQCARLLQHPQYAEEVIGAIAEEFKDDKIDLVVGPATGGIIISYEFARQLGTIGIFTEREGDTMTLRRGFTIPKGARVLVVEDVITTGGSVKEVIDIVKREGGQLVGVAVLVDRTGGKVDFDTKFVAGLSEDIVSYSPQECPLCKEGKIPLEKPGSRKIQ